MLQESTHPNSHKGGLENAIKQAKERGFQDMFIFDADCHQMEPFTDFGAYFEEPYKSMILAKDLEADPWLDKKLNRAEMPGGNAFPKQDGYRSMPIRVRSDTSYPRFQDAEEIIRVFTKTMVDIGIKRSVVLPTLMLGLPLAKPEFEKVITKAYIDYMLDHFLGKYPEIVTLLYAPANSPIKGAEMIDDMGSEKGIVGVMISASSRTMAGSDSFDPIFDAAQRKGLPVCFHGRYDSENNEGLNDFEFIGSHALGFPLSLIRHLVSILLTGVPVRFPNLRMAFMEGGITWVPWLMNRLDDEYIKRKLEVPLLSKLPSEYMKKFYYTSQPLELAHLDELEHVFKVIDAENQLVYASDYPHWDFDVPSVIYDLPFLSEQAKRKILGGNAVKLFNLK